MFKRILLVITVVTLSSCGKETYVAEEAYDYWENGIIGEDVKIINWQFWKSGHWSYEYVVFLELRPSEKWMEKFFEIYHAEENELGKFNSENKTHLTNGPNWFENPQWFNPTSDFIVYQGYGGNYYWNEEENILMFYEMQL
jgi:hypothetical protein